MSNKPYHAYVAAIDKWQECEDVSVLWLDGEFDSVEAAGAALCEWEDEILTEVGKGNLPPGWYVGKVRDGAGKPVNEKRWEV